MMTLPSKNRLLSIAFLCGAFGFSLFRGTRWPNDWAEAHWLISYRFGFLKRGLLGTLIEPLVSPSGDSLFVIRTVTTVLSVSLWICLLWMGWRVARRGLPDFVSVLVFATSPTIVLLAHLNGYYDIPILLLTFGAGTLALRNRSWQAGILLAVAVLIHESVLILGLPVVIFAALTKLQVSPFSRTAFRRTALLAAPPVAALAILIAYQSLAMDAFPIRKEMIKHLAHYPFVQEFRHVIVPEAFTTSFGAYLRKQSPEFWNRIIQPFSLSILVPLGLLWYSVLRQLRTLPQGKSLSVFFVGICLLPLGLHLVAWDTERIWSYPLMVAFFALWSLSKANVEPLKWDPHWKAIPYILVAAGQMIVLVPMMDAETDNTSLAARLAASAFMLAALGAYYFLSVRKQKET